VKQHHPLAVDIMKRDTFEMHKKHQHKIIDIDVTILGQ
jgi:hypothetical protein